MNEGSSIHWRDLKKLLCKRCLKRIEARFAEREAASKEKHDRTRKRMREERKAKGLCPNCATPTEISIWCAACRERARKKMRKYSGGKPWRPGGPGRPPADRKVKRG